MRCVHKCIIFKVSTLCLSSVIVDNFKVCADMIKNIVIIEINTVMCRYLFEHCWFTDIIAFEFEFDLHLGTDHHNAHDKAFLSDSIH